MEQDIQAYIQAGGSIKRVGPSVRVYTAADMAAIERGYEPATRFERCQNGLILPVLYGDDLK
jgi:hypothetical protein